MPDTKITALTAIGANPIIPSTFPIPMVDLTDTSMAASGTTKKVTVNQILGAGGTATLASATITGDLTVDTSTLKVDSANNRVGIGTASVAAYTDANLVIFGAANGIATIANSTTYSNLQKNGADFYLNTNVTGVGSNAGSFIIRHGSSFTEQFRIANDAVCTWSNVGGVAGTAMTLNSTGLGVGGSPNFKLDVVGAANSAPITLLRLNNIGTTGGGPGIAARLQFNAGATALGFVQGCNFASGSIGVQISGDGTNIHQTIDSSGNVGIGVSPVTSHILSSAGPIGISGTNSGTRTSYISNSGACSIYYTDGGGSGFFTDFGNLIIQPRTSAARSVVIATGSTTPVERAVVKSTGQVRFVPLASDPSGAEAGDVYYNSTSNKLKCYNGTTWNDLF